MADFTRIYSSFTPGTSKPVLSPFPGGEPPVTDDAPSLGYWHPDLFGRARELLDENGETVFILLDPAVHYRILRAMDFKY